MSRKIALAFVGFLVAFLGNVLYGLAQPNLTGLLNPWGVAAIVLFTIGGILIGAIIDNSSSGSTQIANRISPSKTLHFVYWVITLGVIALIVSLGIATLLTGNFRRDPYTVYFVVDATDKMQLIYDRVRPEVQIATSLLPDDSKIGFRVYGGEITQSQGCQESRQLLEPSIYPKARDLLDTTLSSIRPRGHSSLVAAVLKVLASDLKNENQPVRLFVVTSGIDPLCDPLSGGILDEIGKDIKPNIVLTIVSIGDQDDNNKQIFERYAKAFKGVYVSSSKPEGLPDIIKSVSTYGYGYTFTKPTPGR